MRPGKGTVAFLVLFAVPGVIFAQGGGDKELNGMLQEIRSSGTGTEIVVLDQGNNPNAFQILPETQITRQIHPNDIRKDEYAGVIFEDQGGSLTALSATVGTKEQIEKQAAQERFFPSAPSMEAPEAPEIPQAPEMPPVPPLPGAEGAMPQAGPGPAGADGATGKKDEASGFGAEEAAQAKDGKDKRPADILSPENPLSPAGGEEEAGPGFVSGKVVSVNSEKDGGSLVIENAAGEKVTVQLVPQLQVINRFLEISQLEKGKPVTVFFESGDEESKIARSIVVSPQA
ncbi:MAG TPA: hypothetical protein PKL97_00890 [Candidatus Omnitrophota bacterium]|nr:hypothetical protein [Candidatus Omnitrophota bacterium]